MTSSLFLPLWAWTEAIEVEQERALEATHSLFEQLQDRLQQSETFGVELIRRFEVIDQAAARRRR
ncbi:hypothetical protein D3C85_856900 [compost metagenome]